MPTRVSRLHRIVSVALIVPFFAASTLTANAQSAGQSQPPPQTSGTASSDDTMAAGMIEGEALAGSVRTSGKLWTGFALGATTFHFATLVVGTGYFFIGPDSVMTPEALQRYANKSADYQLGFKTAWDKKTRSKKRNAFLAGGLLGLTASVVTFMAVTGYGP